MLHHLTGATTHTPCPALSPPLARPQSLQAPPQLLLQAPEAGLLGPLVQVFRLRKFHLITQNLRLANLCAELLRLLERVPSLHILGPHPTSRLAHSSLALLPLLLFSHKRPTFSILFKTVLGFSIGLLDTSRSTAQLYRHIFGSEMTVTYEHDAGK